MNLSLQEKDKLTEIINIGAGNATTALSQLINKRVKNESPQIIIDRIENLIPTLGTSEEIMVVILSKLVGNAPGVMLINLPPKSALNIAGILTQQHKKDIKILDEIDRSALKEIGSITAGSTLTAFAKFLGIKLTQSIPDIATDMFGALIDSVLVDVGKSSETILVVRVKFSIEDNIGGNFFYIFDPKATQTILETTDTKIQQDADTNPN